MLLTFFSSCGIVSFSYKPEQSPDKDEHCKKKEERNQRRDYDVYYFCNQVSNFWIIPYSGESPVHDYLTGAGTGRVVVLLISVTGILS